MKVTFVSNYMNHHQQPFSEAMHRRLGADYVFIQTQPMERERLDMGWDENGTSLQYVLPLWQDEERAISLIADSSVVIFGWTGREELIVPRLREGKLTFRNSERIYKEGQWKAVSPRGLRQKYRDYIRYRNAPYYLLCAGGYAASDFALIGSFQGKMLRWGYFPPLKRYTPDFLREKQLRLSDHRVELLWAGRFIDWKHPEQAVRAAAHLKERGVAFHLTMAGGGDMEGQLKKLAEELHVDEEITFTGFRKPEIIRSYMERAQIFLFTSDHKEGWGAVLNEAMNSGCAVVANSAPGASPYLVRHGDNGFLYKNGNEGQCFGCLEKLAGDSALRARLAENAYRTVSDTWNAERAAENLLTVCEKLLRANQATENGRCVRAVRLDEIQGLPGDGPASIAPIISPRKADYE